jgi:hypothetical protein
MTARARVRASAWTTTPAEHAELDFQQLHVVGSRADIDRFIRTGFTRASGPGDDELHFDRLCGDRVHGRRGAARGLAVPALVPIPR